MSGASLLLSAVMAITGGQHAGHTTVVHAVKVPAPPPVDAALTAPAWKDALELDGFENFTTREAAKYETQAFILYDDKNLYVGVHAAQSGTPIVATQSNDNAGVLSDDHVSFSFDTSGNGSRVYSFKVTPRGIHDETSSENSRYAPEWTSVAKILPNGDYNVMMVIPLSAIRAQSAPVQQWKFNVVRFIAATNDEYTWAYEAAQSNVADASFWPSMDQIKLVAAATRPQPHADVYALGSGGSGRRSFQNGIGTFEQTTPRSLGIDLTYPVTNTLSFVGTLNPDFSNVEQDQTTIAPQMFQRQYQEYRPFFAQGAGYINSMPSVSINGIADTLFYTPGIGIFDRGAKFEGTAGGSSIGMLNVTGDGFNDSALGYSHSDSGQTFRYGAQAVFANHTGLRDTSGGLFLSNNNAHSGQFTIAEYKDEKNSQSGASHYAFASEGIQTAAYFAAIDYRDISDGFNPIDGFTSFAGIRGPRGIVQYNGVAGKRGPLKSYSFSVIADRFLGSDGRVREYDANASLTLSFKNNLMLNFGGGPSALRFDTSPSGDLVNFNLRTISAGYQDGTPTPIDASYSWGPFGGGLLQQMTLSTTRRFGQYGLSLEYDGTVEHASATQPYATQWVRRVSLTRTFGKNTSLAIGFRNINGLGGFAQMPAGIAQTTNLALSFHRRFRDVGDLYLDYGTPATQDNTLHRLILKYVFHAGSGSGT